MAVRQPTPNQPYANAPFRFLFDFGAGYCSHVKYEILLANGSPKSSIFARDPDAEDWWCGHHPRLSLRLGNCMATTRTSSHVVISYLIVLYKLY